MSLALWSIAIFILLGIQTNAANTALGLWIGEVWKLVDAGKEACDQLGGINEADLWRIIRDYSLTYCCILYVVFGTAITSLMAYQNNQIWTAQDVVGSSTKDNISDGILLHEY